MMGQQMGQPGQPGQPGQQGRGREIIWEGELELKENTKMLDSVTGEKAGAHIVMCSVTSSKENGITEVKSDNWPRRLIMQLIPKTLVQTIGGQFFRNSKSVLFHPEPSEALNALTKVFGNGYAGCVHFHGAPNCDIKVLILLYSNDKKAYLGFIPNDQVQFVDRIRKIIQQQKVEQQQQTQNRVQMQQMQPGQSGMQQQQQMPNQMQQMGMMGGGSMTMANQGGPGGMGGGGGMMDQPRMQGMQQQQQMSQQMNQDLPDFIQGNPG